ncbi:hypothetical protein ES702_01462 [subsurface metagenome]
MTENNDLDIPNDVEEDLSMDEKDKYELARLNRIVDLVNRLTGGYDVYSGIEPITNPRVWKTTSILRQSEIHMILSLLTFAEQSPYECSPLTDYCETFCLLKLSEKGVGIDKGIELVKAMRDKGLQIIGSLPTTPQQGAKK